jgi:hypothetical protein
MKINEEQMISIDDFFTLADEEGGIYEIETPQGWVEIGSLVKKINKECFTIRTKEGKSLSGSSDHYIETDDGWVKLEDVDGQNCQVNTKNGKEEIISLESIGVRDTFDLEVLNNEHKYYANDIVSHNTGKTTIGNIICNMIPDHTVIWITPEIISENNYKEFNSIKSLYKLAEFLSPCVVILEDLDLFSHDRDRGGDLLSLGALMNVLDGVNSIKNAVTVGTTNRLKSIESALKNRPGRFDRVIEIPPLPDKLREKMFKQRLKKWALEKGTVGYIVSKTEDWTGAECQEFINSLNLKHISSRRKKKRLDKKWVDEIIETMEKFGIGEKSSSFGFGGTKED